MQKQSDHHFFLGGHDAEMLEIKQILLNHGYTNDDIEDAGLQWNNANVSVYKNKLSNLALDKIPVLIELNIDIPIPDKTIIIDHHDKNAGTDKKTSLEQVAERLGRTLTREQQLISANDKGHIRGMLAMGATLEEIENIRKIDREAQRITNHDYIFADEAISQIQEPFPGVALIDSKTKRTAAIIDKIWNRYQTFIIKAPGEIHVSGPGRLIETLKKYYQKLVDAKPDIRFWFGGMLPSYGFWGSTYYYEKEILKMAEKEAQISQHVFLFPFMIEHWDGNNAKSLDLSDVFRKLKQNVWTYEKFSPFTSSQSYNEYGYFHDYVRTALFGKLNSHKRDTQSSPCEADLFSGETPKFVSCLLRRRSEKGMLELRIKDKNEDENTFTEKTYDLIIDGISLRLFETGIAILAIELINYKYSEFEDIQRINDYGRRVYPQFLGSETGMEIDIVKNTFLADSIKITLDSSEEPENFLIGDYFITGHDHLHIGRHITTLLGDEFSNIYKMEPIIDDRMYTVCWHGNDDQIAKLIVDIKPEQEKSHDSIQEKTPCQAQTKQMKEQPFESSPDWYRFIFMDGKDCMCQDERTLRSLIEASTYRRWVQYGTLYGVSRYSMVCLSRSNAPDFINIHMRRQYRLIAEILLAQRASIITFFRHVEDISKKIDELDEDTDISKDRQQREDIVKNIRKLNRDFLGFKNRLWFIEVTPQEQGIEMYDMAIKNMGLEKQMKELKDEIKELYEYAEMQNDRFSAAEEKRQTEENTMLNKRMLTLTKIAAFGVPLSIFLAFWGLSIELVRNDNGQIFNVIWNIPFITTMIIAVLIGVYFYKKGEK